MATKKGRKRAELIPDPEYKEWDWLADYKQYSNVRGPIPSRPKRRLVVVKSATLDSPASRNGHQPQRTYLSTYRQRMANQSTSNKVAAKSKSPFQKRSANKTAAAKAVKSNSTTTSNTKENNKMATVRTRTAKSTSSKT